MGDLKTEITGKLLIENLYSHIGQVLIFPVVLIVAA